MRVQDGCVDRTRWGGRTYRVWTLSFDSTSDFVVSLKGNCSNDLLESVMM